MKKTLLLTSLCIAAVFVSQTAQAGVKIRAGAGSSTYELTGDYPANGVADYNPVSLGVTYAFDNGLYIDLGGSSGSGTHNGWRALGFPAENFERTDFALTFGKGMVNENNGIAGGFYVGYKSGKTTLGAENTGLSWTQETFTTSGVVFGGGMSFPIASGRAGSVGVNLGLGVMGTEWQDTNGWDKKSDVGVGYSIGANYTYPFTPNFGVVIDYRLNSYKYDFGNILGKVQFMINEDVSSLGATVYAKF
jgi:hypothetical protein